MSFFQRGIDYSKELEENVIGVCLMESSGYDRISALLDEKHFYFDDNRNYFKAIAKLKSENRVIDLVSVADQLLRVMKLEAHLVSGLVKCTNGVTHSGNLEHTAYTIVQMYRTREIRKITSTPITSDMDPNEAIGHLEQQINALRNESILSAIGMEDALMNLTKYQDKVRQKDMLGITTGFQSVDDATSGFVPGGLYIVAARPSVGKSAFMGKNVLHAAKAGYKVGVIQLEMPIEQTIGRIASLYTDIEYSKIITGFKYDDSLRDKFYDYLGAMAKLPIFVNPASTLNIEAIKSFSHAMKRKDNLDILFIDYLQLVDAKSGRSREQEVSTISRGLKLLAKGLDIPVVALSQLNRQTENRANKKPQLSDLRESGAIEQDADAVYFIHRDYAMGIEIDENGQSTINKGELIIAKNRNGSRMTIPLYWDGQKMKFSDDKAPF